MKFVRILVDRIEGMESYGVLEGDDIHIIENSPLVGPPVKTGRIVKSSEVKKFLPPVESPNIIALGLNYLEHAKESNMEIPSSPVIFLKSVSALTGHLEKIILPAEAPKFVDYEAELTIVIKKKSKNLSLKEASDAILGFTCGNDVSARDCQMKLDKQWARAKSFDTFAPVGPFLVTGIDADNLKIESRVNGEVMQSSNTSDMLFDTSKVVEYLSRQMTLLPGTLIMTGTPPGVGFAHNPQVFLREGDIVEVEIENIGTLKNVVYRE